MCVCVDKDGQEPDPGTIACHLMSFAQKDRMHDDQQQEGRIKQLVFKQLLCKLYTFNQQGRPHIAMVYYVLQCIVTGSDSSRESTCLADV